MSVLSCVQILGAVCLCGQVSFTAAENKPRALTLQEPTHYNTYSHSVHREDNEMPATVKKTRYFLDIDPELRNRVKAFAALRGKTMRDWLTEAIIAKLEDEVDASEGLASLADAQGTMSLDTYLQSRQGQSEHAR